MCAYDFYSVTVELAQEDPGLVHLDTTREYSTDTDDEQEQEELDTDEQVAEAMRLYTSQSVEVEASSHDIKERESVDQFVAVGCGCTKWKGKPCSAQFSKEYIERYRNSCLEISHSELDMVIMGQLSAFTNTGQIVVQSCHPEAE